MQNLSGGTRFKCYPGPFSSVSYKLWIRKNRQKTKIMCNIPVLPVAASILDKYKDVAECTGKLLPVLCNQRMNSYLKEIADVCGIHKNLSTHCGRHNELSLRLEMN